MQQNSSLHFSAKKLPFVVVVVVAAVTAVAVVN